MSFRYVGHDDNTRQARTMTVDVDAFLHRYLQHIPLRGKPSVRHYGYYASGKRAALNTLRACLAQAPVSKPKKITWQAVLQKRQPNGPLTPCSHCGAPIRLAEVIPRGGLYLHNNDPPPRPPTRPAITIHLAA